MSVKIEKGIALPCTNYRSRYSDYFKVLEVMEVGDSFFITGTTTNDY